MEETARAFHMIADCSDCDEITFNKYNFAIFGKDVAFELGLTPFGPPVTVHFDDGTVKGTGWSYIQLLEGLVQISGVFISGTKEAYIDVTSYNEFEGKVVTDIINRYFKPKDIKTAFFARQA